MTPTGEVPLVIVSGPAGSGKTTTCGLLAAALGGVHLDKDSLTQVFVEALLAEAGCAPGDREGAYYMKSCRPLEYQVLSSVAFDLVAAGIPAVLDAPFGLELASGQWWAEFSRRAEEQGGRAVVVAIQTSHAVLRQRLAARAAERDNWKLANWESFVAGLPTPHRDIPTVPWTTPVE